MSGRGAFSGALPRSRGYGSRRPGASARAVRCGWADAPAGRRAGAAAKSYEQTVCVIGPLGPSLNQARPPSLARTSRRSLRSTRRRFPGRPGCTGSSARLRVMPGTSVVRAVGLDRGDRRSDVRLRRRIVRSLAGTRLEADCDREEDRDHDDHDESSTSVNPSSRRTLGLSAGGIPHLSDAHADHDVVMRRLVAFALASAALLASAAASGGAVEPRTLVLRPADVPSGFRLDGAESGVRSNGREAKSGVEAARIIGGRVGSPGTGTSSHTARARSSREPISVARRPAPSPCSTGSFSRCARAASAA